MSKEELQSAVYLHLLPLVAAQCQVRNGLEEGCFLCLETTLKEITCIGLIDFAQEENLLLILQTELYQEMS